MRARPRLDVSLVVCCVVLLAFSLPARTVVVGLGALGRPAAVLSLGLFVWWLLSRVGPGPRLPGWHPLRAAAWGYVGATVLAYGLGFARGLPPDEASSSDRALILAFAYTGLLLCVVDGCRTRAALHRVVASLLVAGTVMAFIAHLQFFLGVDVTGHLVLPGLQTNGELIGISGRGAGLPRVAGTAGHYIEFGVLMALLLPIGLHLAAHGVTVPGRWLARAAVVMTTVGCLISISRSAIVALAVVMLFMLPAWSWKWRFNAVVTAVVFAVLVRAVQPGLLGTLRSLFTYWDSDPSISGRTSDYEVVAGYVAERPWLGRGPGTWIPSRYIILDNEWLGRLLEVGLIGMLLLLLLLTTAFILAKRVGRWASNPSDRHLGHALGAALAGVMVVSGTFDALSFGTFAVTTYTLLGCAGALWSLSGRPNRTRRVPATVPPSASAAPRVPAAVAPGRRRAPVLEEV